MHIIQSCNTRAHVLVVRRVSIHGWVYSLRTRRVRLESTRVLIFRVRSGFFSFFFRLIPLSYEIIIFTYVRLGRRRRCVSVAGCCCCRCREGHLRVSIPTLRVRSVLSTRRDTRHRLIRRVSVLYGCWCVARRPLGTKSLLLLFDPVSTCARKK